MVKSKSRLISGLLSVVFCLGLVGFLAPAASVSALGVQFESFEQLKEDFERRTSAFAQVSVPKLMQVAVGADKIICHFCNKKTIDEVNAKYVLDKYAELFENKNTGCCRHCAAYYFQALEQLKAKGIVEENYEVESYLTNDPDLHVANLYKMGGKWYVADAMLPGIRFRERIKGRYDCLQIPVEIYANRLPLEMEQHKAALMVLGNCTEAMTCADYVSVSNRKDIREVVTEQKDSFDQNLAYTFNPETGRFDVCPTSPFGQLKAKFDQNAAAKRRAGERKIDFKLNATTSMSFFLSKCLDSWKRSNVYNGNMAAVAIAQALTDCKIDNYRLQYTDRDGLKRTINLYHAYTDKWYVADFGLEVNKVKMGVECLNCFRMPFKNYCKAEGLKLSDFKIYNPNVRTYEEYENVQNIKTVLPLYEVLAGLLA